MRASRRGYPATADRRHQLYAKPGAGLALSPAGWHPFTGDEVVIRASASARRSDGDWAASPGGLTSLAGHRWQRGGNTPPCTKRKSQEGETAGIGLTWSVSATDRNQPQTPRRPRNEGVRGSNPRVGFMISPQSRRRSLSHQPKSDASTAGLLHDPVTSDLWCREVLLKGCAPCQGPTPESFVRT